MEHKLSVKTDYEPGRSAPRGVADGAGTPGGGKDSDGSSMDPEDHGPDSKEGDGPEHRLSSGQLGGDGDQGAGHRAGTTGAPEKHHSWVRSLKAALSLVLGRDSRCSAIQRLSAWGRL